MSLQVITLYIQLDKRSHPEHDGNLLPCLTVLTFLVLLTRRLTGVERE